MTDKQKRFCDEYLACLDAKQAALNAGYMESTAKNACYWINKEADDRQVKAGRKSVYKSYMREYIDQRIKEKESNLIATQDEILQYLTSVIRSESTSAEIVIEGIGKGCTEARLVDKTPSEKDRLKAAELLGKAYGLYTDKLNQAVDAELTINIDYGDEDLS